MITSTESRGSWATLESILPWVEAKLRLMASMGLNDAPRMAQQVVEDVAQHGKDIRSQQNVVEVMALNTVVLFNQEQAAQPEPCPNCDHLDCRWWAWDRPGSSKVFDATVDDHLTFDDPVGGPTVWETECKLRTAPWRARALAAEKALAELTDPK